MSVATDQPIRKPEDDVLERAEFAYSFAERVLEVDASEGFVVGILGPWGSGKTSVINLAQSRWEKAGVKVLDFNPWMFSGTEQLVERFFSELSAQMRLCSDLADISKLLEEYGEAVSGLGWLPIVGQVIEGSRAVTGILAKVLRYRNKQQRGGESAGGRRDKAKAALAELGRPIVVVLDDIDRLTTSEIRDVFKLVRLTANFPKIIYVLAFDRIRVEKALDEPNISGRDYLEKILQLGFDLPAVPEQALDEQVIGAIKNALSDVSDSAPWVQCAEEGIFQEIIRPLIRNMRDVRRYEAAIYGTVRDLSGQVALVDVLALEAVRVFLPDVFLQMYESVEGFDKTSSSPAQLKGIKGLSGQLSKVAGDRAGIVQALVQKLFPGGIGELRSSNNDVNRFESSWLRERRVAHGDILRLYLGRVARGS